MIKGQMSEFNHNGQQESLMQIFMSDHRELFGFVKNYDSPFFFVCIVICLLRYYVYIFYVNQNYFGLDLPTPGYQRKQIPIPISYAYETPTKFVQAVVKENADS